MFILLRLLFILSVSSFHVDPDRSAFVSFVVIIDPMTLEILYPILISLISQNMEYLNPFICFDKFDGCVPLHYPTKLPYHYTEITIRGLSFH